MRKSALLYAVFSIVATIGLANASSVVTLNSYPAGITDGQSYVGPASLTIDGVQYSGVCYDALDDVSLFQTWNANVYGMVDLSAGAYFTDLPVSQYTTGYQQISYLSTLFTPANESQWVDIQHTIWSVFDPTGYIADASLIAAANAAIASGYDFSSFRYINSPPGTDPRVQGFVVNSADIGLTPEPEPATWFLLCSGVLLMAAWNLRRRAVVAKSKA